MSTHHRPMRTAGVGLLAAIALLTACNDPSSSNPASSSSALFHRSGGGGSSGAGGFSVLAQEAVTCTGDSIIGDVGTFRTSPPGAITLTEGCFVTGAVDTGGPAAVAAYNAFVVQYDALAPTVGECPLDHTLPSTLGVDTTLSPGVYCTGAALTASTVTLTLDAAGDANAVWIFKIGTPGASGTGALSGTDFSVVLANGAQACNVTWWVSQAVTMTRAVFQGNILAGAAITMTGGTLNGNAWAGAKLPANLMRVGDVTFTGTAVTGCGSSGSQICKVSKDKVTGGGWIRARSGDKGTFGVSGGIKRGAFWGSLEFDDHGHNGPTVKSMNVTAYSVIDAVTRSIEGTARINGRRGFTYRVEVSDNGESGRNDTFRLWLSNGYSASGTLKGGNIQLHKAHGRRCNGGGGHEGDDEEDEGHGNGHDGNGHDGNGHDGNGHDGW